ncbi:MAG: undecaprenyl-diphosphate phosphatase [Elusimicrobiota bacterium]
MTTLQAAVYGFLQGAAEFLPISSSAHLSLVPWVLGWEDPGLAFDVALHAGTLGALALYLWRDWLDILKGAMRDPRSAEGRLLLGIVCASAPGALAGLLLEKQAETIFRTPALTAVNLILFGLAMGWADMRGRKASPLPSLTLKQAILIGLAQALAIVPGVSRSGVTITAGLLLGLESASAARFSFLLAMPITFGAVLLKVPKMGPALLEPGPLTGIAVSALTGALAIRFLLDHLKKHSLRPFVLYRLALGSFILILAFR